MKEREGKCKNQYLTKKSYNIQSYSVSSYHICHIEAQGYSTNSRCSCHQGNGVLFQLKLTELPITFLKKENNKQARESVDEETKKKKKSFLNYLRIFLLSLLNYVFFSYKTMPTLYLLGIKENYVCFIFVRNKRKPFVRNPQHILLK